MTEAIIWILLIIVFIAVEAATAALVSIWFAGGALAALISQLLGAKTELQILIFLIVSVVCVAALRGVAAKSLQGKKSKTNLDRIIGQEVILTQEVDNKKGLGAALVNDVEWKVKSEDNEILDEGELVTVTGIEGVRLIVKK